VGLTRALAAAATRERPRLEDGALVGSHCAACGARSWPARAVCSRCGADEIALERLPQTGRLLSYTSVWVARGPFAPPYVLGQADFGDGAVVFGHVRGLRPDATVPLPVRVVVSPAEQEPLDFWFEPELP
jgi:uncharacterized OB-fold protein